MNYFYYEFVRMPDVMSLIACKEKADHDSSPAALFAKYLSIFFKLFKIASGL